MTVRLPSQALAVDPAVPDPAPPLPFPRLPRWSGERVYLPNPSLTERAIANWTRSKNKTEQARCGRPGHHRRLGCCVLHAANATMEKKQEPT